MEDLDSSVNSDAVGPNASQGWEVPARWIPYPEAASAAVRKSLADDPVSVRAEAFTFVPGDREQWDAIIEASDAPILDAVKIRIAEAAVDVTDDEIRGVRVYHVIPSRIAPEHERNLFLHVHGGAFVLGGGLACVGEAIEIALRAGIPTLSIDYRMPPDHPYPAPVDDVVAVYEHLLEDRDASTIAIGGSSAGGCITLAAMQRGADQGLVQPAAMFLGTPATDNSGRGDTYATNQGVDRRIPTFDGFIDACIDLYAGGIDRADPRISPLYGQLEGLPPALLVSGTRDILLSNTVRTHLALRAAGREADLLIFEGLSHAEYITVPDAEEQVQFLTEAASFLSRHLGTPSDAVSD